ncbi:MAG: hypothetical protein IT381_07015 [Deltaproteobacteria bacterium]|nr:hypothetical protein [Deltaproteobacteria bacterium]
MRHFIQVLSVAFLCAASASAFAGATVEEKDKETWWVTVDKVPESLDECTALRDEMGKTPQGGMVYYHVAQLIMIDKPELGEQCLIIGMDMSELAETIRLQQKYRRTEVKGWQLGNKETDKMNSQGYKSNGCKDFAAKSFVVGTETAKGYALPPLPYKYFVRAHKVQQKGGEYDGTWHGFVNSQASDGGAMPYFVKQNDKGVWKMWKSSSFYTACKQPPKAKKDDL